MRGYGPLCGRRNPPTLKSGTSIHPLAGGVALPSRRSGNQTGHGPHVGRATDEEGGVDDALRVIQLITNMT